MPNRIIKESICTSDTIDLLNTDAEVFFYRLIVQCDDFGRMDARPSIVRARCYPLRLSKISDKQVVAWLNKLAEVELIKLYIADDKQYMVITTWEKHQQIRAKRSKYPEPANYCNHVIADDIRNSQAQSDAKVEKLDSNGNHLIADDSICSRNPIQSNPNPIRESESNKESFSKTPFGEFQNIFLTSEEYQKLIDRFGEKEALERIETASESFKSHKDYPKKYSDHYATILSWARMDAKRNGGNHAVNQKNLNGHTRSAGQGDSIEELERFAQS